MNKLFNIEPVEREERKERCKTCKHITWLEYNYPVKRFFYCKIRKSKRTENGLLKIKANDTACESYKM